MQVFSLAEPSSDDGPEMKCKSKTRTAREGGSASLLRVNEQVRGGVRVWARARARVRVKVGVRVTG